MNTTRIAKRKAKFLIKIETIWNEKENKIKKIKNAFYNQLTQITKISDYMNKNITYFKIQKIVNYRKLHLERNISLNNNIQMINWKRYANSFFKQNIIKKTSQIFIIILFYAFF